MHQPHWSLSMCASWYGVWIFHFLPVRLVELKFPNSKSQNGCCLQIYFQGEWQQTRKLQWREEKQAKSPYPQLKRSDVSVHNLLTLVQNQSLTLTDRNNSHRHLLNDLYSLLPHSRKDAKLDTKTKLYQLNELAELYNCNNIFFFEARKGKDLYVWMSKAPNGPTVKMHLQNRMPVLESSSNQHQSSNG